MLLFGWLCCFSVVGYALLLGWAEFVVIVNMLCLKGLVSFGLLGGLRVFVVYLGVRRGDCFALWLVGIAFCGWVGLLFLDYFVLLFLLVVG